MRNIFVLIFLLNIYLVFSQDKEPNPWEFIWGHSSTAREFVLDSFQQKSFLTGFQWSGSVNMNNALRNNAKSGSHYTPSAGGLDSNINLIIQPKWRDANFYPPGYYHAVMMQYEPTLPFNGSNEGQILRPDDISDPIFGFQNRKGTILEDPLDDNYSRLILYKDSIYVDSTVLSDLWPQPHFKTMDWVSFNQPGETDKYLGRKWYLTINLKRLNPNIDTLKNDDVVLKLKMPYKRWDGNTGNISFAKIPINHQDSVEKLHFLHPDSTSLYQFIDSRGWAQQMEVDITETIEITKRMLPIYSDSSESITISSEFHTNGEPLSNYEFSKENENTKIEEIDIEVEYMGGVDIAIDWIRVEEAHAHILMRGEIDIIPPTTEPIPDDRGFKQFYMHDKELVDLGDTIVSTLADVGDIYYMIQSSLSALKTKTNNWQDASLFRLYYQDTEDPSFYWWGALRYVNKITNGMYMTSDGPSYPELYYYYTETPNRYFGMKITQNEMFLANPFMRLVTGHTEPSWRRLGYKYGFAAEQIEDTLTSVHETFLDNFTVNNNPGIYSSLRDSTIDRWLYYLSKANSVQSEWEQTKYHFFYNPEHYNYIYHNKPWYVNLFVGANFSKSTVAPGIVSNPSNHAVRAGNIASKTSEVIRLLYNTNLIYGCKGIFFDREEKVGLYSNGFLGIGNADTNVTFDPTDYYTLIENDTIGADFPNGAGDIYHLADFINKDTISKVNQIDPNRVYIGTKSARLELKKQHDWISHNNIELMDLRLQATFSSGYRDLENWNPYQFGRWNSNPLRRIVNLEGTKTRKLFEPKHTLQHNIMPDYEDVDSAFFDITLLQHKNNTADDLYKNKSAIYLGVQNRRTDPLIFIDSIEVGTLDTLRELMFFSTSEFDDRVRYGGVDLWGVNHDSTWWQSQWWKRLGIREINLPLEITPYGNGTYILAEELGLDSLDSLGWRYDEKYYHKVDTILNYDDSLKVKLLPGQGKIIKMSYVPFFFNDPTKDTIPDNDSCYFCDIYNDFDLFEFNVISSSGELEGCCFDINITYNGNCSFEDIPFRLLFEGESGNTFLQNMPPGVLMDSLGTNIKFTNFEFDLDSTTGTIDLGTYCISDSSNEYTISLLAGKDKGTRFIGCDREMQFKVECGGTEEVKDCCENLTVTDSMYTNGGMLNGQYTVYEYCTTWKIDNAFDSDCIYGVTLGDGDVALDLLPITGIPIDFSQPALSVFDFCTTMAICPGDTTGGDIRMTKLRFLGKDGTTICEVDVPIWVPCSSMDVDDVLAGGPTPKRVIKKDKNAKSFSFDNLTLNLWPNPAQNELNLEINSKLSGSANISLINNLGQSVNLYQNYSLSRGRNNLNINLTDVRQGVYYIQILKDGSKVTVPFVITK